MLIHIARTVVVLEVRKEPEMDASLNYIDEFVRNQMPAMLASDHQRRRLLWRVDELASWLNDDLLSEVRASAYWPILYLDLTMMEAAVAHTQPACPNGPRRFSTLMDKVYGTSDVRGLKYGSLVLDNPENAIRCFTTGEVGEAEALFYNTHRRIEERLTTAIEQLNLVLASLQGTEASRTPMPPEDFERLLNSIVELFPSRGLHGMDPVHFAQFRVYLMPNPHRHGAKGPSGAFSAQVPLLEILFRNGASVSNFRPYLQEHWGYFPRQHRDQLAGALKHADEGLTLVNLNRVTVSAIAVEYARILDMFFYRFRHAHMQATKRQILKNPHTSAEMGTQGITNIKQFLGERIGPIPPTDTA